MPDTVCDVSRDMESVQYICCIAVSCKEYLELISILRRTTHYAVQGAWQSVRRSYSGSAISSEDKLQVLGQKA